MCFLSLTQMNVSLALHTRAREIHQKQERQQKEHENNENTTQKDFLPDLAFLI